MNILIYFTILLVGAYIGYGDHFKFSLVRHAGKIQNYALFFLLFIMGVKIGLDKEIIYSFGTIGLQGIVLAISSIFFSVLGVRLISSRVLQQKGEVGNDL